MEFQVLGNFLAATKIKIYVCWQTTINVYWNEIIQKKQQKLI